MKNYNSAQKFLVAFSFTVTVIVLIAGLLIVTEPEDSSVLGVNVEPELLLVNSAKIYDADLVGNLELSLNSEHINLTDLNVYIEEAVLGIQLVGHSFNGYITSGGISLEQGIMQLRTTSNEITLLIGSQAVSVMPNTIIIASAEDESVYIANGAVVYEGSKIIETGQAIEYRVDRFYRLTENEYSQRMTSEVKDFGYFLYDNDLIAPNLEMFEPELVF